MLIGLALLAALAAAILLGSGSVLYLTYLTLSLVLGAVAATTLAWTLHAWRTPASFSEIGAADLDLPPVHSFSLIVPARHEEAVLESTLSRLVMSSHPRVEVLVVVGDDDPGTSKAAQRVAARHPEIVKVIVDDSIPKSKPKALNTALPHCSGDITGVFDAEDDVHPALLSRVDQRFQISRADIVQAGVQLMNFSSSWLTVRNVLEYYYWFRSRLHLHARQRFIPLGGNTVFVRTPILRAVGGWDPNCLAEDCELGVRLSALGAHTAVFYDPELVTREECPPTLGAFVRQRTRWNQGYLQTLSKGYWRRLPFRPRALGVYILAMPYLLALAWLLIPVAIGTAVAVKAPVGITLISFVPALPALSMLVADLAALGEFCREYRQRASIRDYLRLVAGLPFYQAVLTFASARAVVREARGARDWEKTAHLGLHLDDSVPNEVLPAAAAPGRPTEPVTGHPQFVLGAPDTELRRTALTPALAVDVIIERGRARYVRNVAPVIVPGPGMLTALQGQPLWTRLESLSTNGAASLSPPPIGPFGLAEAGLRWLRGGAELLRGAAISRVDLVIQVVLLAIVGKVLATNALHWPFWQFDEGTYVGYAWAVQHHGVLAPYTYSYGHPPLAWLLIALWTWVSGIVGSGMYSIDIGREFMWVVSMVSCSLLYTLARRLGMGRAFAAGAVILFALCPLALFYHRAVLLDNPAMAWTLAAFVLAATPRRRLWAFAASGACFAAGVLSKETTLVLLPALLAAAAQNTDARTRRYCLALLVSFLGLIALVYPLYATLKGELLPGPGHVSLIGATVLQLFTRKTTGSIFDPHSLAHGTVNTWLSLDPWLVGAALVLSPIALARRSTRPVTIAYLIQVATILRPGYLPNMYVVGLLPFAALIVAGSTEAMWRFTTRSRPRPRRPAGETRWKAARVLAASLLPWAGAAASTVAILASALVAAYVAPRWVRADRAAMTTRQDGPERVAERWLLAHVGHDKRLIVGDEVWLYLIQRGFDAHPMRGGFFSRTVVAYWPLDYDPAVKRHFPRGWRDFDYIVSTPSMRVSRSQTPTASHALDHSRAVASFGSGPGIVQVRAIIR